jgi:O-antigen/teichoic acid export membrane protein
LTALKKLAGDTLLYGVGSMVPRFLVFFLFPIHTHIFAPEEYGVFTKLMAYVAFLNVIYSFGMETTYLRFATKAGADQQRVFNIALTTVGIISLVLSVSVIVASGSLAVILSDNEGYILPQQYIIWLAIIVFIDNVASIPFARLRLEKKAVRFALFRVINAAVFVGLNLYFLYVSFDSAIGIGYIFISNLVSAGLYIIYFFKDFVRWRPTFDRELFPEMLGYSYPIMLTGLAAMNNEFFSRTTLQRWLPDNFYPGKTSDYALGILGACYRFAVLMNLTVQSFRLAAEPFFFSQAGNKDSPELFARINHFFVIFCCLILLAVGINMDVLKYLMDEPYWEGIGVVVPLLLGYMFLGIYYNVTVWYKLTDKTYFGTIITVGGALLTILLNYLLIPIAGYMGSAWASVIVYGFMTAACYLLGQKYFPIPYHVARDLFYIASTTALVYGINSVSPADLFVSIPFHSGVILLWLLAVYLLERKSLQAMRA